MNTAQMIKGQLWVHFEGRTFLYENPNQKRFGKKTSGKIKTGQINAPMPGKIIKLLKAKGESVLVGEVILVMEAMKMEYTLKADVTGEIEELLCKTGDQVTLGKILAKIKEEQVSNPDEP